jgi:hypothetical protein
LLGCPTPLRRLKFLAKKEALSIVHVTYESEMPTHQTAVKKAIKGLLTNMLHDEALGAGAVPIEIDVPATA